MMGPPDDATLDDWRAAFVRENTQRMALLAALDALLTKWPAGTIRAGWPMWPADALAAVLAKHRDP
jgi:hypothetical protein